LGRRYGPVAVAHVPGPLRRHLDIARARRLFARHGTWAVVLGRWVAVLRVMVPLTAGVGGMRRRTFLWANLSGALVWATGVALLGYLASASYHYLEREFGIGQWVLLTVIGVAAALRVWWHRRQRKAR
ncbi:DedA family protein, partial [Micromonospora azadirachtae]